jgi:hypothetical protein
VELGVEQSAVGRLEGMGPPAVVDGGSAAETKGDHVASLKEECRPGGTWAERPSRPRHRPLLPLLLNMSAVSVLLLNRGAHKLIQGAAPEQRSSSHRCQSGRSHTVRGD